MTTSAFATGHVVTAAEFNMKLEAPVVTAELTDGLITAVKLGALSVTGAKFAAQPQAIAYNAFDQSIANTTATVVSLPLDLFDNDTIHDEAANTSRLTCVTAGLYLIDAAGSWAANATGYRQLYLQVNGATIIKRDTRVAINGTDPTSHGVTRLWRLAAGDYVELGCYQNSGGALSLRSLAQYSPQLSMVRIGA